MSQRRWARYLTLCLCLVGLPLLAQAAGAPEDAGHPESVGLQVRILADRLAAGYDKRPGGGRYDRWAVVPFGELGDEVQKHQLGQVVAAELQHSLQTDHGFFCIERLRLASVVKELALAQAGLVDDSKAHQVGTMAGADALVTGTIGQLGDQYVVNARAVSVADGTVLASARVNIAASGLITLASDSVVLRTRSDAVFRSMLVPGWGQMYNHQPDKGTFLMAAAVALAAVGVTFAVLGETTERSYNTVTPSNPGPCKGQGAELFPTCVQNLRSTAQSRYLVADGFFAGLGVLYIYNIIDAAASGGPRPSAEGTQVTRLQLGVSADGVSVRGGF